MNDICLDIDSVLCWEEAEIEITAAEALILLSLHDNKNTESPVGNSSLATLPRKLLDEKLEMQLRHIVYCKACDKRCESELKFSMGQLNGIEDLLPMYGTINEDLYGPLRIKISNAILRMQTVLFSEAEEVL